MHAQIHQRLAKERERQHPVESAEHLLAEAIW
jgi:hypothetical protein